MSERNRLKQDFLASHGWGDATSSPIAGDASHRAYERLSLGGETRILMDAPPEKEPIGSFLAIDQYLRMHELSAPEVFAAEEEHGFVLLEDFGDSSFTRELASSDPSELDEAEIRLYRRAVDVLIELHKLPPSSHMVCYDIDMLLKEAQLLLEWYFPTLNGEPLSPALCDEYAEIWRHVLPTLNTLPECVVLRDYHADNLFWLSERVGIKRVGLIDFQDAVIGSPAYDLVSLLEDARRDVLDTTVSMALSRYVDAFSYISRKELLASYAILGAQRNCKIIGIFSRLAARDKKNHYLKYLPRVWAHLKKDLQHPLLAPLKEWMCKVEVPPFRHEAGAVGKGAFLSV